MHNIEYIRANAAEFDSHMAKRGLPPKAAEILKLDQAARAGLGGEQQLKEQLNKISKHIGELMQAGKRDEAAPLLGESKILKEKLATFKEESANTENNVDNELKTLLLTLPNLLADNVPHGANEDDNVEVKRHGTPRNFSFTPKPHDDIGVEKNLLDFEQTAKISGARFVTLKGKLAKLERALAAFMLDIHTEKFGYTELSVPLLVRDDAMYGTTQLPKFAEDAFKTTSGEWLISTSEISLANQVREQILKASNLPLRMVAYTPCFRSEAGSAGRDTKGIIRLHQFNKVELISVVTPEQSEAEHLRKLNCAEEILKQLELPYRVVNLCTGDIGFSALKTFDLEVWLPAQNKYREISSVSNCGSFQARRMDARYKLDEANSEGRKTAHVHTLNGSGLALSRTIAAILENFQQKDGSVTIPAALQKYTGFDAI